MKTKLIILTFLIAAFGSLSLPAQQRGNPYADQDRPVYLIDCIKEGGKTIVSWKYNGQHTVSTIVLYKPEGGLIGTVAYPGEFYDASALRGTKSLILKALNEKNEVVSENIVKLAVNSKALYHKGKQEKISIVKSPDGAYFSIGNSKEPFVVKGFNYIELRGPNNSRTTRSDHSTFDANTPSTSADYSPYHAETMFRIMKKNGFNTVRVFVIGRSANNPGISGSRDYDKPVYEPYMDNIIDFLTRAQKYGVYVIPTLGDGELPRNQWYRKQMPQIPGGKGEPDVPFFRETVELKQKYILAILNYIEEKKPALLDAIFSLELQNEFALNSEDWPFTVREGKLDMFWGKTYDMSDAESRQQLADDAVVNYHNAMVDAVKKQYPALLVSEGFFTLDIVGKTPQKSRGLIPGSFRDHRYPPTFPVFARTKLDYLDLHIYPKSGKQNNPITMEEQIEKDLNSMLFYDPSFQETLKDKPIILGEFGAWTNTGKDVAESTPDMVSLKNAAMKKGIRGYLYWTFDTFEQNFIHNFMSHNEELMEGMR